MAKTENESIFLDLQALRKELRKAGYEIEARNRIDYLLPVLNEVGECIRLFVRAHHRRDPQEKFSALDALDEEFMLVKVDFHIADDEHIWRGKKDQHGNCKCVLRMAELLGRIDEGISRWRRSMTKGRVAPELQDAAG